MIRPPPIEIWYPVSRWIPGVYPWFISRANAALRLSGSSPSSWWRSVSVNESVGGAPTSQHLVGLALDVIGGDARVWRQSGLIVVDEGDHLHVQAYPAGVLSRAGVYRALGLEAFT